jgi:Haem-binding domain
MDSIQRELLFGLSPVTGLTMLVKLKWSALALGVLVSSLQVVPLTIETTSPTGRLHPDVEKVVGPEIGAILKRSCKDCHSNDTTWPWYSHIAPVSWVITKHVKQGREKLNFSDWMPGKQTANQLAEVCDAVSKGSMPLHGYKVLHPDARLSTHDVDVICDWADTQLARKQPPLR